MSWGPQVRFLSYLDVREPRLLATQEQLLNLHLLVSSSASASPVPSVPASFLLPTSGSVGSLGPSILSFTIESLFYISSPPFQHPTPFPRLAFWSSALPTQSRSQPVPRATCRPGLALSSLGPLGSAPTSCQPIYAERAPNHGVRV